MLKQFLKNFSPWEELTLKNLLKDYTLWQGSHTGAGKEYKEEGAAETTSYESSTAPIPYPPVTLRFNEVEELGMKLSLGRRERWGKGVFILFYFSLSYSITSH